MGLYTRTNFIDKSISRLNRKKPSKWLVWGLGGPISRSLLGRRNVKKARKSRPFCTRRAYLHLCRMKAFEEPITSKWAIVTCVRKSYRVGFSDPSRPDFPEYGYRFFQTQLPNTSTTAVSPQVYYIGNRPRKSTENPPPGNKYRRDAVWPRNGIMRFAVRLRPPLSGPLR